MKKLFLVSLLLTGAGIMHAETPRLVNADGSALSAICIAAVESRGAMHAKAAEFGVRHFNPATLRCNGMTVARFVVATYRSAVDMKPLAYEFRQSDASTTMELMTLARKDRTPLPAISAR